MDSSQAKILKEKYNGEIVMFSFPMSDNSLKEAGAFGLLILKPEKD